MLVVGKRDVETGSVPIASEQGEAMAECRGNYAEGEGNVELVEGSDG